MFLPKKNKSQKCLQHTGCKYLIKENICGCQYETLFNSGGLNILWMLTSRIAVTVASELPFSKNVSDFICI